MLLNLSGYLNLGTDVLIANHLLPAPQAVAYAFWSRALMSTCLLSGLYAQINFPRWAHAEAGVLRRELRLGVGLALLLLPATGAAYLLAAWWVPGGAVMQLPWPLLATMTATAACVNVVLLAGQMSTARGTYAFLWPSAVVACAAPLLALAMSASATAPAFVVGYLAANAALCALNLRHAWRALRGPRAS